ncbi:hypothetical protein JTB14_026888 [Gonioctena quinquepunctata]|nr:hypothetical protein JTB14_026888 [Gonioctena quinquepunctata]
MQICSTCTSTITRNTPGSPCSGFCEKYFHGRCVGLGKQDVGRLILHGALWKCADCKRASLLATENHESGDEFSINSIDIFENIRTEMETPNNKYDNILESVNFCSNQIATFEKKLAN